MENQNINLTTVNYPILKNYNLVLVSLGFSRSLYAFVRDTCFIALAHLRAAVLFFLDISGSCGYTIAQQAALFHGIKSLFMNKPLIIVCNKADLQSFEGIAEDDKKLVEEMNQKHSRL
ncbi:nucleolar GTP-binding protein 1-like protein [Tanacetum coccineum]